MIPEQHYTTIIVAGGKGLRAGGSVPKQFQPIAGKPILMHTIESFYRADYRMRLIVVLPEDFVQYWNDLCIEHDFRIAHTVVSGGETRFHSVRNGLAHVSDDETVGIHDAARPFVSEELIHRCFDTAFSLGCGVIPVTDEKNSVRLLSETGSETVNRDLLKIVQTPQVFPAAALKEAYKADFCAVFTDDASVAEKNGMKIVLTDGDDANIKITTPVDLVLAEAYLRFVSKR